MVAKYVPMPIAQHSVQSGCGKCAGTPLATMRCPLFVWTSQAHAKPLLLGFAVAAVLAMPICWWHKWRAARARQQEMQELLLANQQSLARQKQVRVSACMRQ